MRVLPEEIRGAATDYDCCVERRGSERLRERVLKQGRLLGFQGNAFDRSCSRDFFFIYIGKINKTFL